MRPGPRPTYTDTEYLEAYQSVGGDIGSVAEALNMSYNTAYQRYKRLKRYYNTKNLLSIDPHGMKYKETK